MSTDWQNQWVQYYSDPQTIILRGNISSALWIFSFAGFLLLGFTVGWRYSLIIFIFAIGCETLIEVFFLLKKKK